MIPGTWVLRASTGSLGYNNERPAQVASATTMSAMPVFSICQLSLDGGQGFRDLWMSALTDIPSARRAPTGGERQAISLGKQRIAPWERCHLSAVFGRWSGHLVLHLVLHLMLHLVLHMMRHLVLYSQTKRGGWVCSAVSERLLIPRAPCQSIIPDRG